MTTAQPPSSANLEIIPASLEQAPILASLLELYVYDFSEFLDLKLGADGRFGYPRLPLYWTESHRHPFIIKANDHLAGFVFVCKGSEFSHNPDVWDMAEFFIVRGFRRLGLGMQAAHEIWQKFPGKWEVRVLDRNQKAKAFWGRAVSEYLGTAIEPMIIDRDGKRWYIFSFESKPDT